MSGNKAVAYKGPGVVEVVDTAYPEFESKDGRGVSPANIGRQLRHGTILRPVATNIWISLGDAPRGYAEFDQGAPKKYVLNPNGYINAA